MNRASDREFQRVEDPGLLHHRMQASRGIGTYDRAHTSLPFGIETSREGEDLKLFARKDRQSLAQCWKQAVLKVVPA